MKAKIIEVLKDFRALKPLEQVNQLEYYAEVIHSLYDLPTEEEIIKKIKPIIDHEFKGMGIHGSYTSNKTAQRSTKAITNLLKGER